MSDLIAVTGNLTSPPTRQDVAGGVTMVTFGLASTERRLENGVWNDVHTNFYNVSVFRKLAEHAYASLERGQRVIVAGKLKVRHWEANGRTGTSVDLEATSIGPDLMFGVATFSKSGRSQVGEGQDAAPRGIGAGDGWATVGTVDTATGELAEPSASTVSHGADSAEGVDGEPRPSAPALVGAGAWGAPAATDGETPF